MTKRLVIAIAMGLLAMSNIGCMSLVHSQMHKPLPKGRVVGVEEPSKGPARVVYRIDRHPTLERGLYYVSLPDRWKDEVPIETNTSGTAVFCFLAAVFTNADWRPLDQTTGGISATWTEDRFAGSGTALDPTPSQLDDLAWAWTGSWGSDRSRVTYVILLRAPPGGNPYTMRPGEQDGVHGHYAQCVYVVYGFSPERQRWAKLATLSSGEGFWSKRRRFIGNVLLVPAVVIDFAWGSVAVLIVGNLGNL